MVWGLGWSAMRLLNHNMNHNHAFENPCLVVSYAARSGPVRATRRPDAEFFQAMRYTSWEGS
jgi:hypothetical protein